MYTWWSLCTLNLLACQVWVTIGDSSLCCCVCVTYFERRLTPLFVESAHAVWASFCFRLLLKWRKLSVLLPKSKDERHRVLFIRLKTLHHKEEHWTLYIMQRNGVQKTSQSCICFGFLNLGLYILPLRHVPLFSVIHCPQEWLLWE